MQSNPPDGPKRFSRLSMVVFGILSIVVIVWVISNMNGNVKNPIADTSSSDASATSTVADAAVEAASSTLPAEDLATTTIKAPKLSIHAEIADTEASREQGLSDRAALSKDSGMLFVFPTAGAYGFWMKDMHFPLDMVWIGADKKVSGVDSGVSPADFPDVYYPTAPVKYVLEIASGEAASAGIATGTKLVF